MYVPPQLYRISLSLQDSVSYLQQLVPSTRQLAEYISQRIWAPAISVWQMGVCFLDGDETTDDVRERTLAAQLARVPGWAPQSRYMASPEQLAVQLVRQFPTNGKGALTAASRAATNDVALDALLLCKSVLALHPQVPITTSLCMHAVPRCTQRLAMNARASQKLKAGEDPVLPSFITDGLQQFQAAALGVKGGRATSPAKKNKMSKKKSKKKKKKKAKK